MVLVLELRQVGAGAGAGRERQDVNDKPQDYVSDYLGRTTAVLRAVANDREFRTTLARIADTVIASLAAGGKLLIAGNGGSAADAQHLAAEFLSRFAVERRPLPALALTTDTSVLTAIGNDYGFEQVFARQVRGLGRPGDIVLALSTSGRSPNVLSALVAARETGMATIGMTGEQGTAMRGLCDLCLVVPSDETAIIQQVHMVAGHMICGLVERSMVASSAGLS
jgi:D-sedoheptulose 7-phosphate isomerase